MDITQSDFLKKIIEIQQSFITAGFNLESFMRLVVDEIQRLTPATGVVIELVENDEIVYRAASGTATPHIGLRLKKSESISGLCVNLNKFLISEDTQRDPRVNADACRRVQAGSLLVAPLVYKNKAVGVLKIIYKDPKKFTANDIQIVEFMASFIAAGISHQIIYQEKNDLISILSHELRTPLTAIQGSLSLVLSGIMGDLSEKNKNLLDISFHNCERLLRLINNTLDMQKIESGKMEFDFKEYNIKDIIQEAINFNLNFSSKFKKILTLENNADILVTIDKDKIIQVLTNLISNAVKFSTKNEIKINYKIIKDQVRVEIINHGPPIPEDARKKMFHRFSQLKTSTCSERGSGLGLSISKEIIENHQGTIDFESSNDGLIKFYFSIPITPDA